MEKINKSKNEVIVKSDKIDMYFIIFIKEKR